jgi:hypothetical protein
MKSVNVDQPLGTICTSDLDSVYADVFEVCCTRGEIVLHFGTIRHSNDDSDHALSATLLSRIILSPYAAKRLTIALGRKLHEYETVFGTLIEEVIPDSGLQSAVAPGATGNLLISSTQQYGEKAESLVGMVDSLNIEYGLEHSFKMSANSLMENRFIMGFKKSVLRKDPDEAVLAVCSQMGMPHRFLEKCRMLMPDTEFVHFGFEEHQKGCYYKAYLEFKPSQRFDKSHNKLEQEPFLVFLGFKWNPFDISIGAVSRYICYPQLSVGEIIERLSCLLQEDRDFRSVEAAKWILRNRVNIISNNKIVYEEVTEENNPRKSFDINLYGANLLIQDIFPLLIDMGRQYNLPTERYMSLCDRIRHKKFGHVSGGVDREGNDFLTVYYGVESVAPSQ